MQSSKHLKQVGVVFCSFSVGICDLGDTIFMITTRNWALEELCNKKIPMLMLQNEKLKSKFYGTTTSLKRFCYYF